MTVGPRLWRVFPWDAAAVLDEPFSPGHIQAGQTRGRFDLQDRPAVLYLAETPEHAIGEAIQGFRGSTIGPAHLRRYGLPLALVAVTLTPELAATIPDCTDPATLLRLDLRPDALASHERQATQAIARRLHDAGEVGLRWWSALTGVWHGVALFADRYRKTDTQFGQPEILSLDHPALAGAAGMLGIGRETLR